MIMPIKRAFGVYMEDFFHELVPNVRPLREYCQRDFDAAVKVVPSRMIDAAEDMFKKYLRYDDQNQRRKAEKPFMDNVGSHPHDLPMILVAFSQDVTTTMRDYGHQFEDAEYFQFPQDELKRMFKVRIMMNDIRVQVAFFAQEEGTVRSMAAQFALYLEGMSHRRFDACWEFAGMKSYWPCQIASEDVFASAVPTGTQTLHVMTIDLTLKCTIPWFKSPSESEQTDGKGFAGDKYEPAGYPVLAEANINDERTVTNGE